MRMHHCIIWSVMYPTVGNHEPANAAELHPVQNHLSDRAVCSIKIPKFLICEAYYISKVVLLPTLWLFPQDNRRGCPPPGCGIRYCFSHVPWEAQLDSWTSRWWKSAKKLSVWTPSEPPGERERPLIKTNKQAKPAVLSISGFAERITCF